MTRSVFQRFSRNADGEAIPLAEIAVVITNGPVADIFTSETGGSAVTQPLIADANGFFKFYVEPGLYDVTATDPILFSSTTFDRVEIGTSREVLIDDDQHVKPYSPLNKPDAVNVTYDNSSSLLTATEVQAAIDEVNAKSVDLINDLSQAYEFDTTNDMTSSLITFPLGKIISTKGDLSKNDNLGSIYILSPSAPLGVDDKPMLNGNVAVFKYSGSKNASDISQNAIDISQNTDDITSSNLSIVDNSTLIAQNEVDISALQAGQGSGVFGYATLADMNADLVPDENSIAYVTNDPVITNNSTYRKVGASGGGSWVQSNDDLSSLAYQQSLDAAEIANYKHTYSVCQTVSASNVVNARCFDFVWGVNTVQLTIDNCWLYSQYSVSTSGSFSFTNVSATLDYSVNVDYRFACVDLVGSPTIFFTNRDGLRALTKDQFVVALIGTTTRNIGWCSHSGYVVDGVVATDTNKDLLKIGLSAGATGSIDFDFDDNTIRLVGIFTQDRAALNGPFTQDVTVNSTSRFLMVNPLTGDFKAVDLDDETEYNSDGYYVCAQFSPDSDRLHWCALNLQFVMLNNDNILGEYKDNLTPFSAPIFNPGSGGYIDFDFLGAEIVINDMFMIDMVTYGSAINQTIAIPSQGRFLTFNVDTRLFTILDAGQTSSLFADPDDRLVAVFREEQNTVSWATLRDDFVRVNGTPLSDNSGIDGSTTFFNLLDYVKGQEEICMVYSVPVCDLYRKSGLNFQNKDSYIEVDQLHYNLAGYTAQSAITTAFLREHGGDVDLTGKSIGIFGGSYSVRPAGDIGCKDVWVAELGVSYTNYGIGGYGFAQPPGSNITEQIAGAAVHDIYILWCSTNDVTNKNPIGDASSSPGTDSQSAGIAKCIEDLIVKNPTCKILLFNTVKSYVNDFMYDPTVIRI